MKGFKKLKRGGLNLYKNTKKKYKRYFRDRRSWKSDRKIIIIDSDDWGGSRMPDRKVYKKLLRAGIPVDQDLYAKKDTLASEDDFSALYEVLVKHKDYNDRNPSINANIIMANPDFAKIAKSDFEKFHYEVFTETLKKYPGRSFRIWEEGISEKLFTPQLHGREHFKVLSWMDALRNNITPFQFAFDQEFFAISRRISPELKENYLSALNYSKQPGIDLAVASIRDSVELFESVFGLKPDSFIAPNYCWDQNIEKILAEYGIMYLKGKEYQKHPVHGKIYHYSGEKNVYDQTHIVRNINFEPVTSENRDWKGDILKEINSSFEKGTPAIICSHRLNFIGELDEANRKRTLSLLDEILSTSLKKWPDVEFLSISELINLMRKRKNL